MNVDLRDLAARPSLDEVPRDDRLFVGQLGAGESLLDDVRDIPTLHLNSLDGLE